MSIISWLFYLTRQNVLAVSIISREISQTDGDRWSDRSEAWQIVTDELTRGHMSDFQSSDISEGLDEETIPSQTRKNTDDARNNRFLSHGAPRHHAQFRLAANVCSHVFCVLMHLNHDCVCSVTREFKGPLNKTVLVALEAATGMWGSTSVLWQCVHSHTPHLWWHTHCLPSSLLIFLHSSLCSLFFLT